MMKLIPANPAILDNFNKFAHIFEDPGSIFTLKIDRIFDFSWKFYASDDENNVDNICITRKIDDTEFSEWFICPFDFSRRNEEERVKRGAGEFFRLEGGNLDFELDSLLFDDCKIICPLHANYIIITYFSDIILFVLTNSPGVFKKNLEISEFLERGAGLSPLKENVIARWNSATGL